MKVTKMQILSEATRVFGPNDLNYHEGPGYGGHWVAVVRFRTRNRDQAELHGLGRSRAGGRRALYTVLRAMYALTTTPTLHRPPRSNRAQPANVTASARMAAVPSPQSEPA